MSSVAKTKISPYQKTDGTSVRGHTREVSGTSQDREELPPESYDVTATVEATADSEGKLSSPEVTEVKLKPRRESSE